MKTLIILILAGIIGYSYYNDVSVLKMSGMAKKELNDSGYEIKSPIQKKEGI